jgi:hypothetical protein
VLGLRRWRRSNTTSEWDPTPGRVRLDRVGKIALALVLIAIVWILVDKRLSVPSDDQVVIRLHRDGGWVDSDDDLHAQLAGSIDVSDDVAFAAYCVNGWYWATDVTLDETVLVASNDRYVRAAELVSGSVFGVDLVAAVESERISHKPGSTMSVASLPEWVIREFGVAPLGQYLLAIEEPPSDGASERFVVYAVSESTTEQLIYFVDLQRIDRAAINRFADQFRIEIGATVSVAGSPEPVPVDRHECDDRFAS